MYTVVPLICSFAFHGLFSKFNHHPKIFSEKLQKYKTNLNRTLF